MECSRFQMSLNGYFLCMAGSTDPENELYWLESPFTHKAFSTSLLRIWQFLKQHFLSVAEGVA